MVLDNSIKSIICSPRCLIVAARLVSRPGKRWHREGTRTGAAMGCMRRKRARPESDRMGSLSVGVSTCASRRVETCRNVDLCNSREARCDEKGASATSPRQKTCRKIDLCKSPRRNLSEYRPVQTFQLHKSRFRQVFLSHALRDAPPGQKSVGMSTCASRRAGICRNIDLCKPFSCTSRIFDRLFSPGFRDGSATAQVAIPPVVAAGATEADIGHKWTLSIDYAASWEA